jgi:putative ABC transport system permease protein
MELIKNWWHDLIADRIRIILTIFSVALGTASILLMLALGEGLRLKLADIMFAGGVDILTLRGGATEQAANGFPKNREIELFWEDYLILENQFADMAQVMPKFKISATVEYKSKISSEDIAGVNNDYFSLRAMKIVPGGRSFNEIDQKKSRSVVILGDQIALRHFGTTNDVIGKKIAINNKFYTIIGILQPNTINFGPEPSGAFIWMPIETFKNSFNPQALASIHFKPNNPLILEDLKKRIRLAIARKHNTALDDNGIVHFHDTYTMQQKVSVFMWAMEIFLGLIGGLTLAVAGVGVANIMYLTVKESVHLIGLRMAIGAQPYQILIYYLFEAFLATILGGIVGAILGYGLIELVSYGLTILPILQEMQLGEIRPISSFFVVEVVVCVLVIVALLSGWFPARHAAKMSPAEALK